MHNREDSSNYLCNSWRALLEALVALMGKGYYYAHVGCLPAHKKEKWQEIDAKIIAKYNTQIKKDWRYQLKKKHVAHFRYLRWEHVFIILHTAGGIVTPATCADYLQKRIINKKQLAKCVVTYDDVFFDTRKKPMTLRITDNVELDLQFLDKKKEDKKKAKPQATVRISKQMYRNIKVDIEQAMEARNKQHVLHLYNRLNGIPAWRGVIIQKRSLKRHIMYLSKKHGLKIEDKELIVGDYRKKESAVYTKGSS